MLVVVEEVERVTEVREETEPPAPAVWVVAEVRGGFNLLVGHMHLGFQPALVVGVVMEETEETEVMVMLEQPERQPLIILLAAAVVVAETMGIMVGLVVLPALARAVEKLRAPEMVVGEKPGLCMLMRK